MLQLGRRSSDGIKELGEARAAPPSEFWKLLSSLTLTLLTVEARRASPSCLRLDSKGPLPEAKPPSSSYGPQPSIGPPPRYGPDRSRTLESASRNGPFSAIHQTLPWLLPCFFRYRLNCLRRPNTSTRGHAANAVLLASRLHAGARGQWVERVGVRQCPFVNLLESPKAV
ncbi:uncharacterized protein J3D65DRAFT_218102 [Phyllosticta citribraziliensis]|uniref:Uncharacterized protein n=1 Tax=Phyllosticta citribraziliensis TaxID=989973 RepID=A0ABR1M640_9PEZI